MGTLITGAGGFAGQHLIRDLLGAGDEVFGGTISGTPPQSGTLSDSEIGAVHWIPLDVTSGPSIQSALASACPRRIFHLAAQSSVGASFADPVATWEVNAKGTAQLLYSLSGWTAPVRVLVVSSGEVYGIVPESEQPITEAQPLQPTNPYAASKAAAEMAALQVAAAGPAEVIIARSFTQTGPGQDSRFALAGFAEQLALMRQGRADPVLQVGNLSPRRDYLDVRDAVRAYQRLAKVGENGAVYNVCSGAAHELAGLVKELVTLSGAGARIEVDPERFRPVDIPLLCGDPAKLRALGWTPEIPLRQTLSDLLDSAQPTWVPST